jgi:single-strand DNA-binding protein
MPDGSHALPGDLLARGIGDTTAALDRGLLQERPRGDHGMAQRHRVYFLGNLTRNPEVQYAPNGMAVARCGVAVPTRVRQGDTWHTDVCCIDVVTFGPQAETVGAALRKGRGVLIEGRLQWRRWTQAGQSHFTREVIAERIQCLPRSQAVACEAAGSGSAPQGT